METLPYAYMIEKGEYNFMWIYPGSFDPITRGHLDVIKRAARMTDKLVVAVLNNTSKKPLFTVDERVALIKKCVEDCPNVEVDSFGGLLVDYAKKRDAIAIIKGLRAVSDFEHEMQLAGLNRELYPEIETVFVMASSKYFYVSSTMVKEIGSLGGDISQLVPSCITEDIEKRIHKGEQL